MSLAEQNNSDRFKSRVPKLVLGTLPKERLIDDRPADSWLSKALCRGLDPNFFFPTTGCGG